MPAIEENLKLLRQTRKMTQADVADAIHVTRQTISSYESGRTQPDLATLKQLAELYQADIQDILYGRNRLQQKIRRIKYSIYGLSALLLLGLLIHSILLWAMDAYFYVGPSTVVNESNIQTIELRFALRDSAQFITIFCTGAFWLGCFILLYPIATLEYMPPLRKRVKWLVGLAVAAYAVVIPWEMLSGGRYYGHYLYPVRAVLPAMLLVFLTSQIGHVAKKRKTD